MQTSEYIKILEGQIAETEKRLERLRLKMEVAREVSAELDEGNEVVPDDPVAVVATPDVNGNYRRLAASEAILRFLRDHGPSSRKTVLDRLAPQIKTTSKHPRNIVRNCLIQLVERQKVGIDADGNVVLNTLG